METPIVPKSLPFRIHEALDRIGAALRADDWVAARQIGVNPAQFIIMSTLEGRPQGLGVGEIAQQLGVSQPSATDSIQSLERKNFVLRAPSPTDKRSVRVTLTDDGRTALSAAHAARSIAEDATTALDGAQQEDLLLLLITMIRQLQESGALPIQRMCVSCRFFQPNAHSGTQQPHHCELVDAAFGRQDLRIDCREHETADPAYRSAAWIALKQDLPPPPG